ncbi:MAG: hypothetical protein LBV72_03520 [Tannerella sp.]|jgi:hypothetical protein|nr:hypothetical protein [Tannerella sp.]
MVKRVLFLFALLAVFAFVACNDELEFPEKNDLKSEDAEDLMLPQDSIPGDTIVPRYEEPKYPIDSITPPPVDPKPIDEPKYPTDSIIPSPTYPDPVVDPVYPVDTLAGQGRINTFK